MIGYDLDVVGISLFPAEADFPLLIYPDAILSLTVSLELFQSVSGRDSQVIQRFRSVEDGNLTISSTLQI